MSYQRDYLIKTQKDAKWPACIDKLTKSLAGQKAIWCSYIPIFIDKSMQKTGVALTFAYT